MLVVAGVAAVIMIIGLFLAKDVARERRIYWSGFGVVAALVAIAVVQRGIGVAAATFVAVLVVAVVYVFLRTEYLKIGGTVCSIWSVLRRR